MHIELICIGDELLSGRTVNTNATLLAEKLQQVGLGLARVVTIGDRVDDLLEALEEGFKRSDYLFTTGGLGPTADDLTRDILTQFFNTTLIFHEGVADDLRRRFGDRECGLKNQATIPECAEPIDNPVGTAPGLIFRHEGKKLFVLPGVPSEVEAMLSATILPMLKTPDEKRRVQEVKLMLVNESAMAPIMEELVAAFPDVAFGSYPEAGCVGIRFTGLSDEALMAIKERLENAYPTSFFYAKSPTHALQEAMVERKKKLILAESCTGGALAAQLTSVSGASNYFEGAIVSYSNEMKKGILHVDSLERAGAVSREVVEEMAHGALKCDPSAHFAIAISGIAGPTGGVASKPVGTVWAALIERGKEPMSGLVPCQHKKTRSAIIDYTVSYLIAALWKWVVHSEKVLR